MHAHALGAIEVRRFEREAALVAKLRHKNIVRQLDYGRTEEGVPVLVLELLRGASLRDRLASQGPLSLWRAGQVGVQSLRALAVAHALRIAHRDIKPANIFLCSGGPGAYVRVLDFGIAKALDGDDGATRLTQTGRLVGTPAFMAPEQVRGGEVGLACDVYALGLVLAEAISGRRVVATKAPLAALAEHVKPGEHELDEALWRTPLGPIVARAVRKHPAARYPDADAMLAELEAALASVPHG